MEKYHTLKMKKFILKTTLLLCGIGVLFNTVQAQQIPVMEFYHGATCPHCHREKAWFPELRKLYPDVQIKEYEVWLNAGNKAIFQKRLAELNTTSSGVPTNIINDEVIVGFDPERILDAFERHFGPPANPESTIEIPKENDGWKKYLNSSWPMMSFMLGILDGFNPCAMWTLLILIGFLLSMEDKKKRWLIGLIFVGSSAVIYFGALLAYLLGFSQIAAFATGTIMNWIFHIVGITAIGTGIFAFKSGLQGKGIDCDIRDGKSKKNFKDKLQNILAKEKMLVIIISIIGLAFSVNMIELLCSFAIPTAFTATLVKLDISFAQQILALLIYDIAYILDDILVLFIALWTLNLKVFSPKIVNISHLIGGIILAILGAFLIFDPSFLGEILS